MNKPLSLAMAVTLAVAMAGCAKDAINVDRQSTFLSSDDLIRMTDQMAREIVASPRVQELQARGPLTIVIKPVVNDTNEIIPANRAELFVARLQGLLAKQPALAGRFVWVINRADFEKLRAEEVPELGPSEDRIQPTYALWAEFHSATNITTSTRGDMYVCQYKLTQLQGAEAGATVWLGQYETAKSTKKAFLD